jgi:hypothetical protein
MRLRLTRHRHGTDAVSLIFGLVFIAIAGWGLFGRYVVSINVPNLGWLVAGALILMGLLGVVASLRGDKAPADVTATRDEPGRSPADSTLTDSTLTDSTLTDDEPGMSPAEATAPHREPDNPVVDEEPADR